MDDLNRRAAGILSGGGESESTGGRKKATPVTAGLRGALRAGGLAALVSLSACTNAPGGGVDLGRLGHLSANDLLGGGAGALVGGALAGAVSRNPIAALGGAALGAFGGAKLAERLGGEGGLRDSDRALAGAAMQQAVLRSGKGRSSVPWANPETGNHGAYAVSATGTTANGLACFRVTASAVIGGRRETDAGLVCRDPSGILREMGRAESRGARFGAAEQAAPDAPRAPGMG